MKGNKANVQLEGDELDIALMDAIERLAPDNMDFILLRKGTVSENSTSILSTMEQPEVIRILKSVVDDGDGGYYTEQRTIPTGGH